MNFIFIYPSVVVGLIVVIAAAVRWNLVPGDRKRTEWLLAATALAVPAGMIAEGTANGAGAKKVLLAFCDPTGVDPMSPIPKEAVQAPKENGEKTSRRILGRLARRKHGPEARWKIFNHTRQVMLADNVEVADRGVRRSKGLLGRSGLGAGEGMWIVPCEAVHTFGMRFAIDLVYVNRAHQVKKVRSGVAPWRMSACLSAHSVVELASGTVRATRTQPGDRLEFLRADAPNAAIPEWK